MFAQKANINVLAPETGFEVRLKTEIFSRTAPTRGLHHSGYEEGSEEGSEEGEEGGSQDYLAGCTDRSRFESVNEL